MVSYEKYKMYLSTLKAICQQYMCTKTPPPFPMAQLISCSNLVSMDYGVRK